MRTATTTLTTLVLALLASPAEVARASPLGSSGDGLAVLVARQAAANSSSSTSSASAAAASSTGSANGTASSSNSGSSSGGGTPCSMGAASSDPNQSITWSGSFISTCCLEGAGAMCYTRTTGSGQSCVVPSCADLASGSASAMNGFSGLAASPTSAENDPAAGGNATASNMTYTSYAPDGKAGNAASAATAPLLHLGASAHALAAGTAALALAGAWLL